MLTQKKDCKKTTADHNNNKFNIRLISTR